MKLNLDSRDLRKTEDPYLMSRFWHIIDAALEYFISLMVTGAYLARLTNSLGFSDSLTGVVSSFVSMCCIIQLGSSYLFRNRTRGKGLVILGLMVHEVFMGILYLVPIFPMSSGAKSVLFLLFYCCAPILFNLVTPHRTNWNLSLVPDRRRGIFTAKKEIISLLSGMIFTYLMGNMIDTLEYAGNQRGAFLAGAATIGGLTLLHLVSLCLIKEKPMERPAASGGVKGMLGLVRDASLMRIMLVVLLWGIISSCSTPFYGPYQIKELGFSMTFVSVLSIMYSLVRAAVSPLMGKYADRSSFSHMAYACFMVAAAGFLVNCFTVPENGKVFYSIYYVLYAISMAGINSSLVNLIFDYVDESKRRDALALSAASRGVLGFLTTCLMSPVVAWIQQNGNRILGIPMYPAQFVSLVAFLLTVLLVLYMRLFVLKKENRA